MSMRTVRYLVPAILLLLCLAAQPAAAKRLDGVFTVVKDANVVVLDYGDGTYDIRLYGTEAPADGQAFAAEAKAFVREALLGKNGAIRFKYRNASGEMVSRIFYRPGGDPLAAERDLAVDLVAAGLAWLRPGAKYKAEVAGETDKLTEALLAAQAARRGIWSLAEPVDPWTFRGKPLDAESVPEGVSQGTAGNLDINMSAIAGDDNECAIAKNPNNPQQLVAHCNSLDTPWRSGDGGLTWSVGGTIGSYCCDPNLAWDSFGNLYATFINGGTNAIVTKVSIDAGVSFQDLASFSGSIDQPSVVATNLTGGNVALWIVWNQSSAMVARGALVTGLGTANIGAFGPLQAIATGASCSFGDLSVSPDGAVVQVCGPQTGQTGGNVVINVDADGLGAGGFGAAIFPTTTQVGGFDFIPAQNSRSVDSETGLAYDRNPASPHFGRLFLVYTEEVVQESNDLDVMIRHSDDDGSTWSAATRVNTDATTRSQFLPKIAADPATGNMAVCWHDARNSATNTAMEVWCDTTTPATYPAFVGNVLVSDGASTSNGGGVEFGDYSGLTVSGGIAHPTWADTSNSTGNNPNGTSNFDAYTDRLPVLAADYTLAVTPPSQSICAPANAVFSVDVGAFGGFSDPVTLGVAGNPAGTTAGFSVNPVDPAGLSTLTIGDTHLGTPGNHVVTVSASSTTGPKGVQVTLNLSTDVPAQATLTAPADGATGVIVQPTLSWSAVATATAYLLEVSDDATFTTIDYSTTVSGTSHAVATPLAPSTEYFWRVTATNSCGDTPSTSRSFTTANILSACGGALTISDNASATPYPSIATMASAVGSIVAVEVQINGLTHTFPDDIDMLLVSPSGQKVIFFSDAGGSGDVNGLNLTLSDTAGTLLPGDGPLAPGSFRPSDVTSGDPFPVPAPAGPYASATPVGSATFVGTFSAATVNGPWSLYVRDDADIDVGSLTSWCINLTLAGEMPFLDGFESNDTSAWSLAFP